MMMRISIGIALLYTAVITANTNSLEVIGVFDGATGQRSEPKAPSVTSDGNVYVIW